MRCVLLAGIAAISSGTAACSRTTNLVGHATGAGDAGAGDAASPPHLPIDQVGMDDGDAMAGADAGAPPRSVNDAGVVLCGKQPCACSNSSDDDDDGFIDIRDPECIGPADDDEASFGTGLERGQTSACQDCFFDGNSGWGDDGCRRATSCATDGDARGGSGSCRSCEVTAGCVDHCRPLTPNGCDCFGCCEVHLPGNQQLAILLSPGCSMATLSDETICRRCTKASDCENPCDACELCLGKGPDDLPAPCVNSADPNAPRYTCDDGEPVCDALHACPSAMYCQWGCCLPVPF